MSFKYEVKDPDNGQWVGNGLRFSSYMEAAAHGDDLLCRWMAVREGCVVPSDDPINYKWVDGKGVVPLEMVQENSPDKVCFKKFEDGDVIALFPYIPFDNKGEARMSYMHVGQHGGASPELMEVLDAATEEEYRPLKEELESIGYKLEVIK